MASTPQATSNHKIVKVKQILEFLGLAGTRNAPADAPGTSRMAAFQGRFTPTGSGADIAKNEAAMQRGILIPGRVWELLTAADHSFCQCALPVVLRSSREALQARVIARVLWSAPGRPSSSSRLPPLPINTEGARDALEPEGPTDPDASQHRGMLKSE